MSTHAFETPHAVKQAGETEHEHASEPTLLTTPVIVPHAVSTINTTQWKPGSKNNKRKDPALQAAESITIPNHEKRTRLDEIRYLAAAHPAFYKDITASILPFMTLKELHGMIQLNTRFHSVISATHAPGIPDTQLSWHERSTHRCGRHVSINDKCRNYTERLLQMAASSLRHHITCIIIRRPGKDQSVSAMQLNPLCQAVPNLQCFVIDSWVFPLPQSICYDVAFPRRLKLLRVYSGCTPSIPSDEAYSRMKRLLVHIGELQQLRHLSLSNSLQIRCIPSDFLRPLTRLVHLQSIVYEPMTPQALPFLKDCQHLTTLPKYTNGDGPTPVELLAAFAPPGHMNNHIRVFDFNHVHDAMTPYLRRFTNIQEFQLYEWRQLSATDPSFLGAWTRLRVCLMKCDETVQVDQLVSALTNLTMMEELGVLHKQLTTQHLNTLLRPLLLLRKFYLCVPASGGNIKTIEFLQYATQLQVLVLNLESSSIPVEDIQYLRLLRDLATLRMRSIFYSTSTPTLDRDTVMKQLNAYDPQCDRITWPKLQHFRLLLW